MHERAWNADRAATAMGDADLLGVLLPDAEHRRALAWVAGVDPTLAVLVAGFPRALETAASQLERRPDPRRRASFLAAIRCWLAAVELVVAAWRDEMQEAA